MPDLAEFLRRRGADRGDGRIGPDEIGKGRLDRRVARGAARHIRHREISGRPAEVALVVVGDLARPAAPVRPRPRPRVSPATACIRLRLAASILRFFAIGRSLRASRRSAWARASSVTLAPDSMRAISSRRLVQLDRRMRPGHHAPGALRPRLHLGIRKWLAARAATCGEWVTARTCRPLARRASREPDRIGHRAADAGVDLVEDQRRRRALGGQHDLERQHEARQLAARGDFIKGPSGVPGLAATRNSTRSKPCGAGRSGSLSTRSRNAPARA